MFKTIFNIIVLFFLLLCNIALFSWCVNQLELDKNPIEKTLISNVQADPPPHQPQVLTVSVLRETVALPKPVLNQSHPLQVAIALPHDNNNSGLQIALRFQGNEIYPSQTERARLEAMLQRLNINFSHAVEVVAGGAVASDKNLSSPQTAKLRAQNVARVIYPHTQSIKMAYRSNVEEGLVIVEFFQPQAK